MKIVSRIKKKNIVIVALQLHTIYIQEYATKKTTKKQIEKERKRLKMIFLNKFENIKRHNIIINWSLIQSFDVYLIQIEHESHLIYSFKFNAFRIFTF